MSIICTAAPYKKIGMLRVRGEEFPQKYSAQDYAFQAGRDNRIRAPSPSAERPTNKKRRRLGDKPICSLFLRLFLASPLVDRAEAVWYNSNEQISFFQEQMTKHEKQMLPKIQLLDLCRFGNGGVCVIATPLAFQNR